MPRRSKAAAGKKKEQSQELRILSELRAMNAQLSRVGSIGGGLLSFRDAVTRLFRRNLYSAFGYDDYLTPAKYRERYERGGIATRIVEYWPGETWYPGGEVIEDENSDVVTALEDDFATLVRKFDLFSVFERANILSLLGEYGVVIIGAPGSPKDEIKRGSAIRFLSPLGQDRAKIKRLVGDMDSERYGQPEAWSVDLSDHKRGVEFHWSRVLPVVSGPLDDQFAGKPALRSVWNLLDDLYKVTGGGAEATYNRADPATIFDIDPAIEEADLTEIKTAVKEEYEKVRHNFERTMVTQGMTPHTTAAQVPLFGPNALSIVAQISGATGIPQRVILGSERGEQASTQDRKNKDERRDEMRARFNTPTLRAFVDHLVSYGMLSAPRGDVEEYEIRWITTDDRDETERAELTSKMAEANVKQKGAGQPIIFPTDEIRDTVWQRDPVEVDGPEVDDSAVDDGAVDDAGDGQSPDDELGDQKIAAAADGDDELQVERRAVVAAGERASSMLDSTLRAHWSRVARAVKTDAVVGAIASMSRARAEAPFFAAVAERSEEFRAEVTADLLSTMGAGAAAASRVADRRGSIVRQAALLGRLDLETPEAVRAAEQLGAELVTLVDESTKAAIRKMIADGIRKGIAPRVLARQVKQRIGLRPDQVDTLARFSASPLKGGKLPTRAQIERRAEGLLVQRARLVARTESIRAANVGQRELWKQARSGGLIAPDQKRVWITSLDGRERESHRLAHTQVVGLDEPFSVADGSTEPGEAPNCRCGQGLANAADIARDAARGQG